MRILLIAVFICASAGANAAANEPAHSHPPPDKLGTVHFDTSCAAAVQKLPVTPGPVVPAREQLGELLLDLHRPDEAVRELTRALQDAPGRRAGLEAAVRAAEAAGNPAEAATFRKLLPT